MALYTIFVFYLYQFYYLFLKIFLKYYDVHRTQYANFTLFYSIHGKLFLIQYTKQF